MNMEWTLKYEKYMEYENEIIEEEYRNYDMTWKAA